MYVLQNENPEAWAALLADCVETFRPKTSFEHSVVEEIAFAKWRLRRMAAVETALIDIEMEGQAEAFAARYEIADESVRQAEAITALNGAAKSLALIRRYQTSLERSCERAIRSLVEIRKNFKPELPIDPPAPSEPVAKTEITKRTPDPSELHLVSRTPAEPTAEPRSKPYPPDPSPETRQPQPSECERTLNDPQAAPPFCR